MAGKYHCILCAIHITICMFDIYCLDSDRHHPEACAGAFSTLDGWMAYNFNFAANIGDIDLAIGIS